MGTLVQIYLLPYELAALWLAGCAALLPIALIVCGPRMLFLHFRHGLTWREIQLIDIWMPASEAKAAGMMEMAK